MSAIFSLNLKIIMSTLGQYEVYRVVTFLESWLQDIELIVYK